MGRKSIPILLKATTPEGETKTFTSIGELTIKFVFHYHEMTFQLSRITKAGYGLNE